MDKLVEQLKRHEGFRAKPYKCTAGKWTIGYGFNLDSEGVKHDSLVINEDMGEFLLRHQIHECINDVNNSARISFKNDILARKSVLYNMCFNLGIHGLHKFKKMISAYNVGDFETAAKEMLDSRWAKQVGSRATELAEQMRTGKWMF